MIRMFARRRSQKTIAGGADEILFGISLPSESIIHDIRAQVHVVGSSVQPATSAIMYSIAGYILPVLDPDSAVTLEALWDTLVPKDNDTDTIDLDTAGADTAPFFEPGEVAFEQVLDIGLQPEKIYQRNAMLSFASSPHKQEDTSVLEWTPSEVVDIRVRKRYRVSQPSALVFALAIPAMDDTTGTAVTVAVEDEWPRLKYIELVLEQSLMQFFGLIEAGAETPWTEAAQLLRQHLEPDVFEENAGSWAAPTFAVFTDAVIDHSTVGRMGKLQLGTGG